MSSFDPNTNVHKAMEAQRQLSETDPQLDFALSNSTEKGIPEIQINASHGAFLSILCKMVNAKKVLEIGTLGGYSTIWFAKSVPGVHVTSLEIDPKHREVALENTKQCGNVDILLGDALDILPKLAEKGEVFDFVGS